MQSPKITRTRPERFPAALSLRASDAGLTHTRSGVICSNSSEFSLFRLLTITLDVKLLRNQFNFELVVFASWIGILKYKFVGARM